LVELFEANPIAELAPAMLSVYAESPCSNCRRAAVKSLISTGTAPNWLLKECRSDASESVRRLTGTSD
jgi:hypothetical protein